MSAEQNQLKNNQLAKYAAGLSIIEMGLGGFLHAFKIPLAGQLLSLNQIFILSHASLKIEHKSTPALISSVSALLKSLAPAGKKLTPMLAIAAQGHLYSLGLTLFGVNLLGRMLGATLSALWAYLQPICLYLIVFGKDIISVYDYFFKKISEVFDLSHENFLWILASLIILKLILALALVLISYRVSDEQIEKLQTWSMRYQKEKKNSSNQVHPLVGAGKDLLNPLFLISISLTFLFFFFANSNYSELIWILLRPIGVGYSIFFLLRIMPIEKLTHKMKDGQYKHLLEKTIHSIKK